ncbi:MAG: hypothetical protein A2491_10230 [Bacteroidetes bacterium RIFOXYC12_FULL_35_7]|nr:MAG: hypothetical protein A2491_10230 [Bacteroidetes bacterium RIFOXYC12_FULL_35_7]
MEKHFDIIIIGAGPAGLIAAARASQLGNRILVLEKMAQAARKLRITGKGRCNITNTAPLSEFVKCIHPEGKKLRPAFSRFFSKNLIDFFAEINIPTKEERGSRIFPLSDDANVVADALISYCKTQKVEFLLNAEVQDISISDEPAKNLRITINNPKQQFSAHSIIIATGGLSYPATGCTGDGYKFAKQTNHLIIPTRPALVPLRVNHPKVSELMGLSLKNVTASLWVEGKKMQSEFGEMLFTHFGLSGPIILTLSRLTVDSLNEKKKVQIQIDLKPALDDQKLDQRLLREIDEHGKMKISSYLKLLLPGLLAPFCAQELGFDSEKQANTISALERKKLRVWLKNLVFNVVGHTGFKEAIITAGGVSISDINLETFESKKVENVYFAGEVLDFDADTGGYNLQIAFTTGWLAGEAAAKQVSGSR